jgi:hypothetical protein
MKKFLGIILVFWTLNSHGALNEVEFLEAVANFQAKASLISDKYHPQKLPIQFTPMWDATPKTYYRGAGVIPLPGGEWNVQIAGWTMRNNFASKDAVDFILCHELGHASARFRNRITMAGHAEQDADDFAARSCLRLIWGNAYSFERIESVAEFAYELRSSSALPQIYDPQKKCFELILKAARQETFNPVSCY